MRSENKIFFFLGISTLDLSSPFVSNPSPVKAEEGEKDEGAREAEQIMTHK